MEHQYSQTAAASSVEANNNNNSNNNHNNKNIINNDINNNINIISNNNNINNNPDISYNNQIDNSDKIQQYYQQATQHAQSALSPVRRKGVNWSKWFDIPQGSNVATDVTFSPKDEEDDLEAATASTSPTVTEAEKLEAIKRRKRIIWAKRIVKLLILAGIVVALVFASNAIASGLQKFRDGLGLIPLNVMIPVGLAINALRKLVPPAYVLLPVGTIYLIYFADKVGPETGAWIHQLMNLEDILLFLILRRFYQPLADVILNPERKIRWMSDDLRNVMHWLEENWRHHLTGRHWVFHVVVVTAWNMAMYMEDYVSLFWLATRSPVHFAPFSLGFVLGSVAQYVKSMVEMKAFVAIAGSSTTSANLFGALKELKNLRWYEIFALVMLTGVATIYVHGFHLMIVIREFHRKLFKKKQNDATTTTATNNDDNGRVEQVLPATGNDQIEMGPYPRQYNNPTCNDESVEC